MKRLALLLLVPLCGCFNLMSHVKGRAVPYGGTVANVEFTTLACASPRTATLLVVLVPDLPCEVAADTLTLLPWDVWHDGSNERRGQ